MRRRLADISYTVSECYLQENRRQGASWKNIMLTFRRNLQQIPANKNSVLVGQADSGSYMSSGFV